MSCPISDRFIRKNGVRRRTINILSAPSFICGIIRGWDVNKAARKEVMEEKLFE